MARDKESGVVGLVHTYPHDERVPGSIQRGISVIVADLLSSGQWDKAVLAGGKIGKSHLGDQMVPQIHTWRPELADSDRVTSLGVAVETRGEQRAFAEFLHGHMRTQRLTAVESLFIDPHTLVGVGVRDWLSHPRFDFDVRLLPHTEALLRVEEDTRRLCEELFTKEAIRGKANYDRITRVLRAVVGAQGVAVIGRGLASVGSKEAVEAVGRRLSFGR